ncbi:xanthine dehydrogenase family protein molybdopterin-binding subunit [Pelomonas sp. Root1237]|uniref:xanthine dehydrogenase family protein molybdopterin-binding subunit n=1 Tax=Pelomonas sp. Root1237 TaxID=1736434 RepID=UPI0006F5E3C4|nr:xanthine dehydrogenase family protein molybdopterin-binding subunit [Pelomonas sp. Root1237]KQV96520.1 hypothetical protein ASC91_02940 [Pelomonas sp. Root1237]
MTVPERPNGRATPRLEAELKVTGAARYAAEQTVQGLLHAALVQADVPSGVVRNVDATAALAMPGVVALLWHANAPRVRNGGFLALLQDATVHFAGQPVALVIAESPQQALRAAAAVKVDIEPAPAITAMNAALGEVVSPKEAAGGVAVDSRRGEPERELTQAAHVLAQRYTTPTHNHLPLEPHAVVTHWEQGRLTVHTSTQAVFGSRRILAHCFDLPPERVRVVAQYVGGGFGSKGRAWFPALVLGVMAARHVQRPVRLELTRAQMFCVVGRRQETVQDLKIGMDADGRLRAIVHDALAQTSTFAEHLDPVATPSRVLYGCAHVATTQRLVRVNAPQPNPMRAPGEGPGSFALESALDELAHRLDIDPLELRLRNLAERDMHTDLPWSSNGLETCLRVAADAFGWSRRPRKPQQWQQNHSWVGWGMASALYPVFRMACEASVGLSREGVVCVRCGTQDIGTGTLTVLAQIAAEAVGVPLAAVQVELGDTDLPEGPYSGGSIATASFTPAVEEAARGLKKRILANVVADPDSPLYGLASDQVTLVEGLLHSRIDTRRQTLAAWAATPAAQGLQVHARTAPAERPAYSAYGFGAVFAEVHVDATLGTVRVTRITAAYAAGRILNPMLARSQYVGGLVGGIGMALHEATLMDQASGRVVNTSLSDYLVPVHADMPRFDIHIVEEDDPHLAGGIKGIGMLGTVGTAAAIANAVFHATGRRLRDLPIRLEHLL